MNPALLKFLPLLFAKNKKWLFVFAVIAGAYQLISPNGVGATWGVPSIDTFYKEPRDILVDRVVTARDVQQETAEEFKSALEKFKSVTQFDGGDLEKKFTVLNAAFERSESAAGEVTQRVDQVVKATNNLLEEWRDELADYHDAKLRQRAEQQLDVTRKQAEALIVVMRQAESKTKPVLDAFRDQVLFMKHNLNMQAISALQKETVEIEQDVSALIAEMEASIAQADAFIKLMDS